MHNIYTFHGENKPNWEPNINIRINKNFKKDIYKLKFNITYSSFLLHSAITTSTCQELIEMFELQSHYPVGINGFSNDNEIGSVRCMGWSPEIAEQLSEHLRNILPKILSDNNHSFPFDSQGKEYFYLGSTPWLRFMRYNNGGMHTPHYDCSFINEHEQYLTLYSWVMFLNTPNGIGGNFQFIHDEQQYKLSPMLWDMKDHLVMSEKVLHNIQPRQGSILIFPHWLCHQVEEFIGDKRYIIRGDIAYGYQ